MANDHRASYKALPARESESGPFLAVTLKCGCGYVDEFRAKSGFDASNMAHASHRRHVAIAAANEKGRTHI